MSDETSTTIGEIEELLGRLQAAQRTLMDAVADAAPDQFEQESEGGDSLRRILERSADDVNFYYGRLVAQALSLPQRPGMELANFESLEEAKASLQVAHRGLSSLLHDLVAEDLDRKARLESTSEYTLRQVLETAVAHYRLRTQQVNGISEGQEKGGQHDPRDRR